MLPVAWSFGRRSQFSPMFPATREQMRPLDPTGRVCPATRSTESVLEPQDPPATFLLLVPAQAWNAETTTEHRRTRLGDCKPSGTPQGSSFLLLGSRQKLP